MFLIEISQTVIDLARNYYGENLKIYHGFVTEMPFEKKLYDGIFCYALIHLLDEGGGQNQLKSIKMLVIYSYSIAQHSLGTPII